MERNEIRREIKRLQDALDEQEREELQPQNEDQRSVVLRLRKGERLTIIISKQTH